MLIGILSDTHDRVEAMAEAMRVLKEAGARYFIHCGDVGSERVLDYLAGEPGGFVFGNTDWDRGRASSVTPSRSASPAGARWGA